MEKQWSLVHYFISSNHFNIILLLFREQGVMGVFDPVEINAAYSYPTCCSSSETFPNNFNTIGKFQSVHTWRVAKAVPIGNSAFHLEATRGMATAYPICKLIFKSLCNKLLCKRTYERLICQSASPHA